MLPRLDTSWIKKLNNGLNITIKAIPRYEKKKTKTMYQNFVDHTQFHNYNNFTKCLKTIKARGELW